MAIRGVDHGIDTLAVLDDGFRVAGAAAVESKAIVGLSGKGGITGGSRRPGVKETAGAVEAETVDDAGLTALLGEGRGRWRRGRWRRRGRRTYRQRKRRRVRQRTGSSGHRNRRGSRRRRCGSGEGER